MTIDNSYNDGHGEILLAIARSEISRKLGESFIADEDADWLQQDGACFVTLTQHQQLRGCIGSLEATRPLLEDVKQNAVAAAFRDPRFTPLTVTELPYTEIEVSLLSTMQLIDFSNEHDALAQLQPGKDGVVFEYGRHRSTFLPQVWEQLPSVADFMSHLKRKAGLSADFWSDKARLYRYSVSKWRESDYPVLQQARIS